jgi:hypothetical protein
MLEGYAATVSGDGDLLPELAAGSAGSNPLGAASPQVRVTLPLRYPEAEDGRRPTSSTRQPAYVANKGRVGVI